ncbi:MAG: DUF1638 domain-containing protein [Euryarchaeota archaeon]|nr:DUF1638 domain-containing protein [Euryarchaeota archaeon]
MELEGKVVSGRLMMMVCPLLEDEMVYNLTTDPDKKRIFLLTNRNTDTLIPKLRTRNVEFTQISEEDFFNEDAGVPRDGFNVIIWMMDLGLHSEPKDLGSEIRRLMLMVPGHAEGIALYYGLCGRGLEGVQEWAKENLPIPMTLFTDKEGKLCDDCICVPFGSSEKYLDLMKKHTGMLYLTPAVACSWKECLGQSPLFKGLDRIDMTTKEYMKLLFDMAGYTHCLKIQTNLGDQEHFQVRCEEYAKEMGLELTELESGWVSTEVADHMYAEAKSFLRSGSV